ncbi:MAG: cyclase family protein [Candidatus Hodarchaeales archaeon]|jgi:arylformamidase
MKLFDISMKISENMIFYPGDPTLSLKRVLKLENGDPVNLSQIEMGVHTGTHLDAPLHFIDKAASVTDVVLDQFYGVSKVLNCSSINFGKGIAKEDLLQFEIKGDDIILLKTKNSEIQDLGFRKNFVYLTLEGAAYLASLGIKAVGIDYLSIEKYNEEGETHRKLLENNIAVYEGLNLANIDPGEYIFCGFPLKLMNSEGSPVRAVLIQE